MKTSKRWPRIAFVLALACSGASCGAVTGKVGGETNWLMACDTDADCGLGSCSCGLCTRECANPNACDTIPGSVCSSSQSETHTATCGDVSAPPICVPDESETPEPRSWADALSQETLEGEAFYRVWGSSQDLWALGAPRPPRTDTPPQPGNTGLICPRDWSSTTIVRRKTENAWTTFEHPATTAIQHIHGTGPNDSWMVGLDGAVFHFNGSDWTAHDVRSADGLEFGEAEEPCAELSLHSVFARAPDDVWVVGYIFPSIRGPGLILHFDGQRWERHVIDALDGLFDVWAGSAADAWAVGSTGIAYRFDGESWSQVETQTEKYLMSVFGTSVDDVWIAGDGGTLRHFDGANLSPHAGITSNSSVQSLSGSTSAGLFLLTSAYQDNAFLRQDLMALEDGEWVSFSHTTDADATLSHLWVTPEGELWGAGNSILRFR